MSVRTGVVAATIIVLTAAGLATTSGPAAAITADPCNEIAGQVIDGTDGPDILYGTTGNDVFHGRDGDDIIYGYGGNDEIHGGGGDDILFGGPCHDDIYGNQGNDILAGSTGVDELYGRDDDDVLLGDASDTIVPGPGANFCDVSNMSQSAVEASFTYFTPSTFSLPATAYAC
jgi:Ca2+-binding RTX toxin-like protein